MFVFKAAVLGAGTMGGEIAQVIASADVPVVLKDVEQEFVDAGLEKAREVTQGQLAGLVSKEKITQELEYRLRRRGPFAWLTDRLFIRSQVRGSLARTLARLKLEVEELAGAE